MKTIFNSKTEKEKLEMLISRLPENRKQLAEGLVDTAAFQIEQIDKLQRHIRKNGWSEQYKHGQNQYGNKRTVEGDTYLVLQKNYVGTIRQLSNFLPTKEEEARAAGERLLEDIRRGKPKVEDPEQPAGQKLMEFIAKGKPEP